jgi:acetyl-CoA carboxylase biotin carboxyl carrier protein
VSEETKPASSSAVPFDVPTVKSLIELMDEFEVNEIDLRDGERRILLRRGFPQTAAPSYAAFPQYAPPPSGAAPSPATGAAAPAAPAKQFLEIKSPMVGTFYAKPGPDKDDYVKVGARVSDDTVVCKIEAMKIFNDLPAGVAGTIVEVVAQNAQFVEFDQVLFRVDPL